MSLNKNYSLYYNVLEFFRTIMKNHPSLNYVSQGDVFSIDTREFPQYPLGNIIVTGASFGEKFTDYTCQITIADKSKLKGMESSGSFNELTNEFEGSDDTVDIHANTLSIMNDLTSYIQRKEEGMEIQGNVNCIAFKERFDNGLAGWSADFTLRVHNDRPICLFDLNPADNIDAYKIENCATSASFYVQFSESVPEGSGSFWSNEIEGTYQSYNIVGLESIEEKDRDFGNITPTEFRTYEAPSYVNYKWFTDCNDANTNYTYDLVSLAPNTVKYIDENGDYQTYTGIGTILCAKGIIDLGSFGIADTPTEGCA